MCILCDSLQATLDQAGSDPVAPPGTGLGALVDGLVRGVKWPGTALTYAFAPAGTPTDKGAYVGGSDTTSAATAADQAAARAAFDHISSFLPLTFTEVSATQSYTILFHKVEEVPGGWAGYADYPSSFSPSIIVIDSEYLNVTAANNDVLIHEIGHAMGLEHTHNGTAVFPGVTGENSPGDFGLNTGLFSMMTYAQLNYPLAPDLVFAAAQPSFMALDIAALQYLYGANTSFAQGNTVYGIADALRCIWDTGGADIIDFSATGWNSVIDLRAASLQVAEGGGGYLSYVMEPRGGRSYVTGGYTIANGVAIENARGGEGNDQITGNTIANYLDGGLGNDTIRGGAGNDSLFGSAPGAELPALVMTRIDNTGGQVQSLRLDGQAPLAANFTIDMVLQFDSSITHEQRIVSFRPDNASGISLDLQLWDVNFGALFVIVQNGNGLGAEWTGIDRDELMDGGVHRLTLSRDSASGVYRFYLDGVFKGSVTNQPGVSFGGTGNLVFGQSQGAWTSANDPGSAMSGAFGDIAIYNAVLSDAQVAARSITALADTADARLTALWHPAAGQGTSVTNLDGGAPLVASAGMGTEVVYLRGDDDSLSGEWGNDQIMGGVGNDTLEGGDGADFIGGGAGNDLIDGGAGANTIFGGLGNDTVQGGADGDQIYGSAGRNQLFGNDGNDFIQAGNGGDFIGGGNGNDTIRGGDGADTIYAGLGNDNVGGGAGNDVIYGSGGSNVIYAGLGNDTVQGGAGSDTIYGSAGRNLLLANDGNDVIYTSAAGDVAAGGSGNDTVLGGAGNDTIYAGLGNDFIGGGAGNDFIVLGAGTNTAFGGVGNDTINAGTGRDVMNGGPGADVFVFASAAHIGIGAGRDVITDFTSGVDDIDLRALGTSFNGSAGLVGGGAKSFFYFAAGGLVIGDQNGDGVADWVLELTGKPAVVATDFLF